MEKKDPRSNIKLNTDCVNCLKEMMKCFPDVDVITKNCSEHLQNYSLQGHNYFKDILKPDIKQAAGFVNDGRIPEMVKEMPNHPFCSWLGNDASYFMSFQDEGKKALCENLKIIIRNLYMSTFTEGVFGEELKATWKDFIEKNKGCDQKTLFSKAVQDKEMFSKLISSVTKNDMISSVMSNISPILESFGPVELEGETQDSGSDVEEDLEDQSDQENSNETGDPDPEKKTRVCTGSVYGKDFFPETEFCTAEATGAPSEREPEKMGDFLSDVLKPKNSDLKNLFRNQSRKEKKNLKKHTRPENGFKTLSKMIESMTQECSASGEESLKSMMEEIQNSDIDLSSLQDFSKFVDPKTGAPDISKLPEILKDMGAGSEDLPDLSALTGMFQNMGRTKGGKNNSRGIPDLSAITGIFKNMGRSAGGGNNKSGMPDLSAITEMFQNMGGKKGGEENQGGIPDLSSITGMFQNAGKTQAEQCDQELPDVSKIISSISEEKNF